MPGVPAAAGPAKFVPVDILGVAYQQAQTADGGDLYLTGYGLPFKEQLMPENWRETGWFLAHRQRLRGTSTIYRTQTKPAGGASLDIVVRSIASARNCRWTP